MFTITVLQDNFCTLDYKNGMQVGWPKFIQRLPQLADCRITFQRESEYLLSCHVPSRDADRFAIQTLSTNPYIHRWTRLEGNDKVVMDIYCIDWLLMAATVQQRNCVPMTWIQRNT